MRRDPVEVRMTQKSENNPNANRGDAPPAPGTSLRGVRFPATKAELVQLARDNDAAWDVIEALEELPDRRFADMQDVLTEYGSNRVHGRAGEGPAWHAPKK